MLARVTLLSFAAIAFAMFSGCQDVTLVKVPPPAPVSSDPRPDPPPVNSKPVETPPGESSPANKSGEQPAEKQPTPIVKPAKPTASIDELLVQLRDAKTREYAANSLAAHGTAAVPTLLKTLDDQDWQVRAAAVFALGQIGKSAAEAKTHLQTLAEKDENPRVRDAAAFAVDAIEGK